MTAPLPLSGFRTPVFSNARPVMQKAEDPHHQDSLSDTSIYETFVNSCDPYPSWNSSVEDLPITRTEIETLFMKLMEIFGFQYDNTRNMFDYFLKLLDSRASRMGPYQALRSLHADYIGGRNANYRAWYFASKFDIDDAAGWSNVLASGKVKGTKDSFVPNIEQAEQQWAFNMNALNPTDLATQVGLYLLCWGEANNVRFMPECLCFIFKCCNDYYYSLDAHAPITNVSKSFLDHAITPIYNFYRNQSYEKIDGKYVHVAKDHDRVIGYDDMNQLFWYMKSLERLVLKTNKTKLMAIKPCDRYKHLLDVDWQRGFHKTFYERRNWAHVLVSFNRVWIIHVAVFWYYTAFNSPTLYTYRYLISNDNQPSLLTTLTVMSLGGSIAVLISFFSLLLEAALFPRKWPGAQGILGRLLLLFVVFILNTAPSVFIFWKFPTNQQTNFALSLTSCQFVFSLVLVAYLSFVPLGQTFWSSFKGSDKRTTPIRAFTANFYELEGNDRMASYGLWTAVFSSKFLESYYFLTLSLRDPVRELSIMKFLRCSGDVWLGNIICVHQAYIVLGLIFVSDLILFFLDTYLWYIVWNTVFSVCRSFYIGVSIWTPWRNIFSRLPKRIYSKLIAASNDRGIKAKYLVSQVWNSIIISMYREHLLSLEHVQALIYKQIVTPGLEESTMLKEPIFFMSQDDQSMKSSLWAHQSEAQRRITFFAQSLSTILPDVGPVNCMPSFTVLVPHYCEKITLSLKEIIREEEQYSHVTMLEYLKQLHPMEWTCFVRDTKMLADEFDTDSSTSDFENREKLEDLPYYSIGFKVATPEYILRTRIWASLRSQTLYRTVTGFMNYSRAIKLLFDVENPDSSKFGTDYDKLEAGSFMALKKFRLIVSMQRMRQFSAEEKDEKEFLLRTYPELQIAYLDEEINPTTGEVVYYSALIDGSCPLLQDGERKPKYRVRLSGYPILGDGKSDNQNHSLIFSRGEYIQLIDANQDNYLEECLKIRNLLSEFDEAVPPLDPYSRDTGLDGYSNPVAIVGTREYIFSENIGVLGDIAAGKEQTFGTLFARTLAHIGGKLHYGHPDFLNGVFMTTRGGVSKAQKGLHLNEDIYAGISAISRGGRIKHSEYMQCGKGRDLGFGSILSFTTKIGAGMGEQMLSREYYYMCLQLPLDRFLSFYYAHPGFHLNNVFIILSTKLFLLVGINIAALASNSSICEFNKNLPITDPRRPIGCHHLIPVVQWLERCILSIFIVFEISFVPLWIQELTERGIYKALTRMCKHIASFSPVFEVFVTRVYSQSLVSDITIGGARYIATGRGFATVRVPFSTLYSRFAVESLYFGIECAMFILFCSITMWSVPLIYFWVTAVSLLLSPFFFNPNQYSWNDFFLDYKEYLEWLSRGNTRFRLSSWISYTRSVRIRHTGYKPKRRRYDDSSSVLVKDLRSSRVNAILFPMICQLMTIALVGIAYMFANSQNDSRAADPVNSILRILITAFGPIAVNMIVLAVFFVISLVIGPVMTVIIPKFPSFIAFVVRSLAVVNHVFFFELLWFMQQWNFGPTLLGLCTSILIQKLVLHLITSVTISREFKNDWANRSWWSGKWLTSGLGWHMFTQPLREYLCKTAELSYFVADMIIGHLILYSQIPILLIPYADRWHSMMLFWLTPNNQMRLKVLSKRKKKSVRINVFIYSIVFLFSMVLAAALFIAPLVAQSYIDFEDYAPSYIRNLVQPYPSLSPRRGLHKGLYKSH